MAGRVAATMRGTFALLVGVSLLLTAGGGVVRAEVIRDLDFQLAGGYRQDQLDWNIAGTPQGGSPNVLSELKWEDLEIYQVRAQGKIVAGLDSFPYFDTCVKGAFGYGWIVDGDNRDSDYLGDNRTQEFSRSDNKTEDDDVLDASIALGPRFGFRGGELRVTPLVGWSYHEQNLRLTDGFQSLDPYGLIGFTGPFAGLDSTYQAEWKGGWAGLDLEYRPVQWFSLSGGAEYHWADFQAEADWNLRSDLAHPKSFVQQADGTGVVLSASAVANFNDRWSLEVSYDYQDWETEHGCSRTFLADGTVVETRLNEVNWESQAVMLGVTYRFF